MAYNYERTRQYRVMVFEQKLKWLKRKSIPIINKTVRVIDLSNCYLTRLPDIVYKFPNVSVLILNENPELRIDDRISNFTNLSRLEINNIGTFDISLINSLKNIEFLSLKYNYVSSFPTKLKKLKELYLDGNKIPFIPIDLPFASKLRILSLSNNQLSIIPQEISNFASIEKLDLSNNNITELPDTIFKLINIISLSLKNNKLAKLPKSKLLKEAMESINDNITSDLQFLDLSNNKLTTVPEEISIFKNLKHLNLKNNEISTVSKYICSLGNLENLDISNNRLQEFNHDISLLTKLINFKFHSNNFIEVPKSFYMIGNYSQNHILKDNKTEKLDLRNMNLTILSPKIGDFKNLKSLDIRNNELCILPQEIQSCQSLEVIYLSNNKFTIFPSIICKIKTLKSIYLSNNPLQVIPQSICNLTELQILSIRDCPVIYTNKEVCKSLSDLKSFFHEERTDVSPRPKVQTYSINNEIQKRHIKISGDNNITLQDINGSNIQINDISAIKEVLQTTSPEYIERLYLEIKKLYNVFIEKNRLQTEIIANILQEKVSTIAVFSKTKELLCNNKSVYNALSLLDNQFPNENSIVIFKSEYNQLINDIQIGVANYNGTEWNSLINRIMLFIDNKNQEINR